jgi:head-tail adaptor
MRGFWHKISGKEKRDRLKAESDAVAMSISINMRLAAAKGVTDIMLAHFGTTPEARRIIHENHLDYMAQIYEDETGSKMDVEMPPDVKTLVVEIQQRAGNSLEAK